MADGLASRTAVVTGAAGHVGRALNRLLPAAGYRVIGVDRPDAPVDTSTAGWIATDLADPRCVVDLTRGVEGVDAVELLVNAAGLTALGGFSTTDDDAFVRVVDVNLHGALRATRAVLDHLRRARGHVVTISSVAGLVPTAGRPAYVAAKHAATAAFRVLATELEPQGVAVSVLHPSFLDTPVTAVSGTVSRSTAGRTLDADDVARAVLRVLAHRRRTGRTPVRVLVGPTARAADLLHRIAPEATVRLVARRLGEAERDRRSR